MTVKVVCPCCGIAFDVEVGDEPAPCVFPTKEELSESGYDLAQRKEVSECPNESL